MNRLEQDAAEELAAHEQRARVIRPRPMQPYAGTWAPPPLIEQQKHEFEQYSRINRLPF